MDLRAAETANPSQAMIRAGHFIPERAQKERKIAHTAATVAQYNEQHSCGTAVSQCDHPAATVESQRRGSFALDGRPRLPKFLHLWHQAQRIPPARFDERVRAIVREELAKCGRLA
jgi:hypothetical protein